MSDDLERLETWVAGLLAKASPAERRRLARVVAVDLRRDQAQRIAGQRNPDGSPYEARKIREKAGRIRRRALGPMFRKLRAARSLTAESDTSEARVGFRSARTARIARVHQEGLMDRVERRAGAPEVRYPQRVLLGFTEAYRERLLDLVMQHLER